ncbi:MAG: helix-turn-helix domain-containing protein [Flavobacterium sp.]|nr:MAG: helix-turn-helix domain-containing protein [Flavobacterium sp.]
MRFEKIIPSDRLKPYIKHLIISEATDDGIYKVFPTTGLVIGFQYSGKLAYLTNNTENNLASIGITGIQDKYKIFKQSANIGSILVFFNEIGASYFFKNTINELFNQSLSLDYLLAKSEIDKVEELLNLATTDQHRIIVVENFLLQQLLDKKEDLLVSQAIKYIHHTKGNIKIKQLSEMLFISQSPLEKRFRKIVGITPKKFASIIRFNTVLDHLKQEKSFAFICNENNYFDQAHLIHDFKTFTGETPDKFEK